ncbi:hypothetical protein [Streptomyces viridosporus]|uniref:DUF4145 domain-containing protein n=1 Tax=Streptomyces viridosporus T7A TaxID=665577 RepID=A0ABX6AEM3_STRVD|nr:hypothetical protein [Streptomyces viridosporus]QEU86264.1 hypothetical protein CP969_17330 [Streptomyces viridosporus T7A]
MNEIFDDSTLTEIAHLICGDETPLLYRKGFEIAAFFQRAGWDDVPEYDGTSRHRWARELLKERQEDGTDDVERAILRLANRLEYYNQQQEYHATLKRLNEILVLDGRRIGEEKGQAVLIHCEAGFEDQVRQLPCVELKVSVTEVVSDPELAATVQLRLDEARTCYEHGAYTSAVIMLGSLLEGVLAHAAQVRAAGVRMPKPLQKMGLNDFVNFAYENKWIERDAHLASELVRHYRNLVHPLAEKRTGHSPNRDTLDMCWPVVNATLNDLAATAAEPPAMPSPRAPAGRGRGRNPNASTQRPTPASVPHRRPGGGPVTRT